MKQRFRVDHRFYSEFIEAETHQEAAEIAIGKGIDRGCDVIRDTGKQDEDGNFFAFDARDNAAQALTRKRIKVLIDDPTKENDYGARDTTPRKA